MSITTSINTNTTVDSVMIAMQRWRNNNKNKRIQQPIPISIWHQVFTLSKSHSPSTIRKLLSISKAQYDKKFSELFPTQQPPQEVLSEKIVPAVPVVEFCEVNATTIPQAAINSAIKHKPHYEAHIQASKCKRLD